METKDLVQTLIAAGRILEAEGQGDFTRGHISALIPGGDGQFYMKPHGYGFDEMTPENLVVCDHEGTKIGGEGRRHSEVPIHSEIYRARPDVQSVVHSHAPFSVAFAACEQELLPFSQGSSVFFNNLPVFDETIDLIRTKEQGERVAKTLGQAHTILLKGHGVVTAGRSIEDAVMLAIMLESACRIHLSVAAVRKSTSSPYPDADVISLREKVLAHEHQIKDFEYLRRKHCAPASNG